MLTLLRRSRTLALAMVLLAPGVAGTAVQWSHSCPAEAQGSSSEHQHHSSQTPQPGPAQGCDCIGSCSAAAVLVPPRPPPWWPWSLDRSAGWSSPSPASFRLQVSLISYHRPPLHPCPDSHRCLMAARPAFGARAMSHSQQGFNHVHCSGNRVAAAAGCVRQRGRGSGDRLHQRTRDCPGSRFRRRDFTAVAG